jgi:hypothetical protein
MAAFWWFRFRTFQPGRRRQQAFAWYLLGTLCIVSFAWLLLDVGLPWNAAFEPWYTQQVIAARSTRGLAHLQVLYAQTDRLWIVLLVAAYACFFAGLVMFGVVQWRYADLYERRAA